MRMEPGDTRTMLQKSPNGSGSGMLVGNGEETLTIDLNTLSVASQEFSEIAHQNAIDFLSFGKLLEAIPVPTLLIDRTHEIKCANAAFIRITLNSFDPSRAKVTSMFPDPDEANQAVLILEKVFMERKPIVREKVLRLYDGRIWARMHFRTVKIGRERYVLLQIENRSAHKQLFAIQKYKKLMKTFPVGIVEFAVEAPLRCSIPVGPLLRAIGNARVVDGNNLFANLYGHSEINELTGLRLADLFPCTGKRRRLYKNWIQRGFSIRSFETHEKTALGSVSYFENTLLGNVSGQHLLGFWWLRRDISEKKRTEEEVLKGQKLESLGILAGGIAHDFNNFLTGVLGNISQAQKYLSPDHKAFSRLEAARNASIRAKELTRQLLTFSKGGLPIKKAASIGPLLRDSVTFALRGSKVAGEFVIPENLWPVDMDEGQIGRALHNLVINAEQAMPRGGRLFVQAANVKLKGAARLPVTNERCVKISIRDTGLGIPPDILPKIFDPYFTTKEKGTGLGLSTAYSIIRKHDGFITAKSDVGIGTTFTIYLPVSSRFPETKTPPKPSTLIGRGRVLLMDDQDLIRDLANELLTDLGYEVCAVKDGAEAVTVYREAQQAGKHFEVVVMDLTVPGGMGGQEAILKLRQIDPHVRAIASSGYSNDPIMADYHKYGFVGVLPKPYTLDELAEALKVVTQSQEIVGR